jgi:hypothetical protein
MISSLKQALRCKGSAPVTPKNKASATVKCKRCRSFSNPGERFHRFAEDPGMELGDAFYVKNRVDKSTKAFRKQARRRAGGLSER